MPINPGPNRRSFLARSAAIAAVPAVAALAGGALAEPAAAGILPDYAPVPPSAPGRPSTRRATSSGRPGCRRVLGRLAAANVFTADNAYVVFEALRVDYGTLGPFGDHP